MIDDYGVRIRRWTDEELKQFEAAWNAVVEEGSADDARLRTVAKSYFGFRERYRIWGDVQLLESTYQ